MGIDNDTEIKMVKDTTNYITFEKVQEFLNLSNPKLFKKYLHEVFQEISTTSEQKNIKYISRLIFHDYIKLSIFISDKLFDSFKNHIKEGLIETEFVSGFYQLYMGNFEETTQIIFNLLDFDKDGKISSMDMLINFKLLLGNSLNEEQIKEIVNKTINEYSSDENKEFIYFEDFKKILEES